MSRVYSKKIGSGGGSRTHYSRVMSPAQLPNCPRNSISKYLVVEDSRFELLTQPCKGYVLPTIPIPPYSLPTKWSEQ